MTNRSKTMMSMLAAAMLAGSLLTMAGCGKNKPSRLLVPTGIRPAPTVPTGGLFGFMVFDTVNYAGLGVAPYPPTIVELFRAGLAVDTLMVGGDSRRFEFSSLLPGDYTIVARSHAFRPGGFGLFRVVDAPRDAGDLSLSANTSDSLAGGVYVIGDVPGYTAELILDPSSGTYETYCANDVVGLWLYPNPFYIPTAIPAGTHRFKFVTDASSVAGNWIGWGGDGATVLSVPATNIPARFGSGPANDILVNIPTTGVYAFTFDERRLIFSIVPAPTATTVAARERNSAPALARRSR